MGNSSEVPVLRPRCGADFFASRRAWGGDCPALRRCRSNPVSLPGETDFLAAGEAALRGGTRDGVSDHEPQIADLEHQIESRDQVFRELTIANRVLEKRRRDCVMPQGVSW